jgi:hypothetical protein
LLVEDHAARDAAATAATHAATEAATVGGERDEALEAHADLRSKVKELKRRVAEDEDQHKRELRKMKARYETAAAAAATSAAELQSVCETRDAERGQVAAAEARARDAEHAAQAAVNTADLAMRDARARVAAAEQETQRQLEAAELSRRDIEKAVRERLTVEEQLLAIKFERRTLELEADAKKRENRQETDGVEARREQVLAMERAVHEHQQLLHRLEIEREQSVARERDRDTKAKEAEHSFAVTNLGGRGATGGALATNRDDGILPASLMDADAFAAAVEAKVQSALQAHAREEHVKRQQAHETDSNQAHGAAHRMETILEARMTQAERNVNPLSTP